MTRVLLLGAGGSAGINFARAAAGHAEVVGADVDPHLLQLSPCGDLVCMEPICSRSAAEIDDVIREEGIDLVHAQPDAEVQWLSDNRHDLPTFLPSADALATCADKLATAQTLGDLAPKSYNVSSGALERGLGGEAWIRLRRGAGSTGALPVRSNAGMEAWIEHWHRERGITADAWMIAEILPGRDLSWTGVYAEGRLQASAAKERTVSMGASRHPANVSSTASVQMIVRRPDLNAIAEEAVLRVDPEAQGVWMIDAREDADGVPRVTEINCGRFGTTSEHFAAAGGNLVAAYLDAASGARRSQPLRDCCRIGETWLRAPDALPTLARRAA